ncbi:hypothetical protein U8607_24325 [Methylobacterium durans]|uniref:hypothetical protein n=1 Tax=Methylobacterium durans TaxID=2202825 RepID=UPI002AFFCE4E|nr:hypothetical protein [Methylobacterium durans]MEA1835215.1 hypothetical protein [Methylobacterium durans]
MGLFDRDRLKPVLADGLDPFGFVGAFRLYEGEREAGGGEMIRRDGPPSDQRKRATARF